MSDQAELSVQFEDSRASGDDGSVSGDACASNAGSIVASENPATLAAGSRNSSRTSFDLAVGDAFREIRAANLHEYSWPPNSVADRYFIQEQLSVLLDAKSFKRKYPDLSRRAIVDADERAYLLQNEVVTQMQLNMGLTALRAEDVYDLMMNDYPEKFEEFKQVIAERNKKALAVKQMELQAVKSDSKRLEEWRKKAISSATEWNADLNRDRSRERRCFFDTETMVIQEPVKKRSRPQATNFGPYPTAPLPGQFQSFYKKYNTEELNKLPVNCVVQADDYLPTQPSRSPEPITVKPEELLQTECEDTKKETEATSSSTKSKNSVASSSVDRVSAEEGREETGESCAFCQEDIFQRERYVRCSKCGSCGHPTCMDMSKEMYDVIKGYNWMCMECKPCSICSKLDEEDKMLFCDRCDRGYHTFCVGLSELPSGRWVCSKFCLRHANRSKTAPCRDPNAEPDRAAEAAVAAVVATPSTVKPNISLEETVEAVAQAVLAAVAAQARCSSSPASSDSSRLISTTSLSNSPQPPSEARPSKRRHSASTGRGVPCSRCGAPTSRGRRKIALCTKCLLIPLKVEQEQIEAIDEAEQQA